MEQTINRTLLEKYLYGFRAVLTQEGDPFSLTAANRVYANEEMYKYKILETAESLLCRSDWSASDIWNKKDF